MFTEFENYGCVICNNPTDIGLTAVQNFCGKMGYKLPIVMVVSIGTGIYPAMTLGNMDAQNALYSGKKWLHPTKFKHTQNLLTMHLKTVSIIQMYKNKMVLCAVSVCL